MELFALTPKFVPTPAINPHRHILDQVNDFVRKLQWRLSVSFSTEPPRFGLHKTGVWPPRNLVPRQVRRWTQQIFHGVHDLLRQDHSCHLAPNLQFEARNIFSTIRDQGCTVTTADKGGRWTLIPTACYRREALRQLQQATFYSRADNHRESTGQRILQILNHLKARKFISAREYKFLLPPENPRDPRFRLLPKLHKPEWPSPTMPPGRPIVSDTGSVSRNAGDLIEYFLYPLCTRLPSHLKDTRHLIAILRSTDLPPNATLFTLDVDSLYTNIPIEEGVNAVATMFAEHPQEERPDLTLLTLLRLILRSNVFKFEDSRYLQLHGVAMGQVFGGSFANIFLGQWEKSALASSDLQPYVWLRFQDDIFGIWQHPLDRLHHFVTHLNGHHPCIKLKPAFGTKIAFLDLTISVSGSSLNYEPFFKETDSHLALPPTSHHPSHTFGSLLYGEILRFARNSSTREAFVATTSSVTPVWRKQGHSRTSIRKAKLKVLSNTGQLSQWTTGMFPCTHPNCSVCQHVKTTAIIRDATSQLLYPITCRLSCESRNVLYVIECARCSKKYVGETGQTLRARISQHLAAIRDHSPTPVHAHFTDGCPLHCLTFYGIAIHPNDHVRTAKEEKWIATLNTRFPQGLNRKRSDHSQRTNLVLPYCACSMRVASAVTQWCPRDMYRVAFRRSHNLGELTSPPASRPQLIHSVQTPR